MRESRPREERRDQRPTFSRTEMMWEVGWKEEGSRLWWMEPLRMNGSWGIVMMRSRMMERGMWERSRPSIRMVPESLSSMRRRTERRVDLPL